MNYQTLRDIAAARPRALAFLVFLALLNLGLMLYLSGWQRPELDKARDRWQAHRQGLESGQSASNAAALYRRNLKDLEAFDQRLIAKKDFASFLERLFRAAKGHGLSVKSVTYTPAPVKQQPGLVAYEIGFTLGGKYPAVKAFIAEVEGFREIVTLNSLSLNNASTTEESVDLKMSLTAYLKREGA